MAPISRVRSRAGRRLVVLALLSLTALAVVLRTHGPRETPGRAHEHRRAGDHRHRGRGRDAHGLAGDVEREPDDLRLPVGPLPDIRRRRRRLRLRRDRRRDDQLVHRGDCGRRLPAARPGHGIELGRGYDGRIERDRPRDSASRTAEYRTPDDHRHAHRGLDAHRHSGHLDRHRDHVRLCVAPLRRGRRELRGDRRSNGEHVRRRGCGCRPHAPRGRDGDRCWCVEHSHVGSDRSGDGRAGTLPNRLSNGQEHTADQRRPGLGSRAPGRSTVSRSVRRRWFAARSRSSSGSTSPPAEVARSAGRSST